MGILYSGFRTTLSNILNNKQTFALSVATITISIFILGLFLILFLNLNSFFLKLNNQIQLIAYLNDDITASQKSILENYISNYPKVESVKQVSREQALAEFQSNMPDSLRALLELDFNPLPASYNIHFAEVNNRFIHIRELAEKLKNKNGIESVEYGEDWIAKFEKFMTFSRIFLLALGCLLCLGLTFIISNTIRLSIYSRQKEIELMLLIGATPRFVKIPFLLEGAFQGLVGSVLALFFISGVQYYLKKEFQPSVIFINKGFESIGEPILLALVGLSICVGLMASYISTFQFLRLINKN